MLDLLGAAGCVSIEAGVESLTEEGRAALDKQCRTTTDDLAERLIHARRSVPFVQANLIEMADDDPGPRHRLARAPAAAGRLGQRSRAALSLSEFARLPDALGRARRPRLGAGARPLPRRSSTASATSRRSGRCRCADLEAACCGVMTPSRHVLMTTDAVGGVWTYALDLAAACARDGTRRDAGRARAGAAPAQVAAGRGRAGCDVAGDRAAPRLDWRRTPRRRARGGRRPGRDSRARRAPTSSISTSPRWRLRGAFDCPVVAVCHSCVATWWAAVRGRPACRPTSPGAATSSAAAAARADAARRPEPRLRAPRPRARLRPRAPQPIVVHNGRAARACAAPGRRSPRGASCSRAGRLWDEGKNAGAARRGGRAHRRCRSAPPARSRARTARASRCRHLDCLGHARRRPRSRRSLARRPIFVVARAATSRSASRCWRRRRPAAPWCCPTSRRFRELWDGAAVFVDPRRCGRLAAARSTASLGDPCARAGAWRRPRGHGRTRYAARRHGRRHARDLRRGTAAVAPPARRRPPHEDRLLHPFARLLLEPRQRAFPARRAARADPARA